ncbi:hypothetical protein TPHA_0C04690 [Tetrapisispora phaffii CBS 4417]|uniref:Rrn9 domain-containing protein n=1 Tax=Tetrapisispora phaffii (strain ATCC 24235 / CBS 4417 / NBRC 1672 / NRRL Y-8282 / UCD 70-5) TaxID=1071381 RepID=G8BQV7_TETPH|nr:hypothetical protein TPHA_0C04690 [Tetrapisispora phaffii CBS 4417]CCE62619.1 hypothetical protein TPHA_0C04690 [Tetrapisispora phaffii CBS 4417]
MSTSSNENESDDEFQDNENIKNSFSALDSLENEAFGSEKETTEVGDSKKNLDKNDLAIFESAKEILETLEHTQRTDLALHLYSSYLLRTLLYKANEKRHIAEIDLLYTTQVKENWVSWPNSNTIIDPKTDKLYEDDIGKKTQIYDDIIVDKGQILTQNMKKEQIEDINLNFDVLPGEVSTNALIHGSHMMERELDAYWQKIISESAISNNDYLDIDTMNIPSTISDHILSKLDLFFEGLHNQVAQQTSINIKQSIDDGHIVISQPDKVAEIKENKHIELDFHDVILRSCDMGENMQEIYMKCLQLFNDIPKTFDKQHFKLPKHYLKKFSPAPKKHNLEVEEAIKNSRKDFIAIEDVLKKTTIKSKQKAKLAFKNRKNTELNINKKVFYKIQGPSLIDLEDLDYTVKDALL